MDVADNRSGGVYMKLIGATACLAAVIGLSASPAGAKPKHSPQHELAVQKCTEAYEAAAAAAHAPNSPKGQARKRAMHAAAEAKKDCIAKAPK
jgi:hypothetical protein